MPQERGFPDINIVMEKVAFDGITRFEDRERMPLGALPLPHCAYLVGCSASPAQCYPCAPSAASITSQHVKLIVIICCQNAGMVFNATSWGAKLLMQAAYNTKVRRLVN